MQQAVGNDRRVRSTVYSLCMAKAHEVNVAFGIVDTAHHALVIAEEEDGEAREGIDGDEEGALLELVGDVPLDYLVAHGERRGMVFIRQMKDI